MEIPVVTDNSSITGDGTSAHPLMAVGGGGSVFSDGVTITGDGTSGNKLATIPDKTAVATDGTSITGDGVTGTPLATVAGGTAVAVDGTTITGDGTTGDPLVAVAGGVVSLNALTGALSITSPDSSVTITPSGTDVELEVAVTSPGGANTNVQYNDGGAFGGDANFTWDKTSQSLTVVIGVAGSVSMLDGGSTTGLQIDPGAQDLQLIGGGVATVDLSATGLQFDAGSGTLTINAAGASASGITCAGTFTIGSLNTADAGLKIQSSATRKLGFYGSTPIVKPTVTGSKASGAALASFLATLAALGLIVDGTTA